MTERTLFAAGVIHPRGPRMVQVVLYVDAHGVSITERIGAKETPKERVERGGVIFTKRFVHHVPEVSESDRATAHAMAVTS